MTSDTSEHGGKTKQRSRAARLIFPAVIFAGLCGLAAAGVFAYFYASSPTVRDTIDTLTTGMDSPEKAFPGQDGINVLILGRDLDRDPQGRIVNTRGRTDTIMLAHIDFRSRSVSVLSIPRDTLVRIPGYRGKRRIAHANALGGPELARKTVAELLELHPDYFMLINFDAFEKAIDAVSGLEVTVDKKLDYDDYWGGLHIHLEPGRQVLDGQQALGFVRYRQSNDGVAESDCVRITRQQELLRAARSKLSSPSIMFRIPGIVDNIRNDIEGNLTPAQMICLARFLRSIPSGTEIRMETLPVVQGGVFVRADPDAAREFVQEMFFENQP